MKRIEDFFHISVPPQLQKRIDALRAYLSWEVQETLTLPEVHKRIWEFIRIAKKELSGQVTHEKLEGILAFIGDLFENFPIRQVYKSASTEELKKFSEFPLASMLTHIAKIRGTPHSTLAGTQWGSCINWSIFFYKLFEHIDTQKELQYEIVHFPHEGAHVFFVVTLWSKRYIIDVFSGRNYVAKELKVGDSIYIGTQWGKEIIMQIVSTYPLAFESENIPDLLFAKWSSLEEYLHEFGQDEAHKIMRIITYTSKEERVDFWLFKLKGVFIFSVWKQQIAISQNDLHACLRKHTWNSYELFETLVWERLTQEEKQKLAYVCELFTVDDLKMRLGLK